MTLRDEPLEFRRIDALARIFRDDADTELGIGDDAAVLQCTAHKQVWTIDAAVEHVHFERAWLAPANIGYRAFMAAASDVAAMGARATQALCAWTLPDDFGDDALRELAEGVERASRACDCPVVGGNLSRGVQLTLTTTVLGRLHGSAVRRRGGKAGQRLCVTGPLGAARVGLEALRTGRSADAEDFVRAFRAPSARLDLSEALSRVASCAIDLSDGLLPDLAHLCRASEVGARIELAALPQLPGHASCCEALGLDPTACLLAGGEEYELLLACDPSRVPSWAVPIGTVQPREHGVVVLREDGTPHPTLPGFTHFGS